MDIASTTAEAGFSIDKIKEVMDGLDPAALLPDLDGLLSWVEPICRIAILVGPILLIVFGLSYLLLAPKEANHYFGYTTYFGMGSVNAWRYSQKIAGVFFGASGIIMTVIMLVISGSFGSMDAMDMVTKAAKCLGCELVVIVLNVVLINVILFLAYDRKGRRRRKKA